jgi:hypothetical protein
MSGRTRWLAVPLVAALAVMMLPAPGSAASTLWADTGVTNRIIEIGKSDSEVMEHLDELVNGIGMRPAGSKAHHEAAEWAYEKFVEFGLSNVHLEQCGDWPGYPDAEWTDGFLDKLSRIVRIGDESIGEEKRVPVYNVVADIPGTDMPDEYVIIGAHYDSVPIGEGALDNGTGVAAALEAARILSASGARPRRTIRFVLFAGEESGLLGSRGYVENHPDLLPKVSAMYNMDHGTNYISGISATEPLKEDMDAIFAPAVSLDPEMPFNVQLVDWLLKGDPNCCEGGQMTQIGEGGPMVVMHAFKQMPDGSLERVEAGSDEYEAMASGDLPEGAEPTEKRVVVGGCAPGCGGQELTTEDLEKMGINLDELAGAESDSGGTRKMRMVAIGSSDQSAFLAAGVPGFWWAQDGDTTVVYPAHTAGDTYDKAIPEYLGHNATVIALGTLGTANLDHMLSREKLTQPNTDKTTELMPAGADGTAGQDCDQREKQPAGERERSLCDPGC